MLLLLSLTACLGRRDPADGTPDTAGDSADTSVLDTAADSDSSGDSDSTGESDTIIDTGDCPEGSTWDGATCLPDECGAPPFGDVRPSGPAHYVDPTAAAGGDGSAKAPFTTIASALGVAANGDTIVLAAGTYDEAITLSAKPGLLSLTGRCPQLVRVAPTLGTGLTITGAAGASVAGITFGGSDHGIDVNAGTASFLNTYVADAGGPGLVAQLGAVMTWSGGLVSGNEEIGILVSDEGTNATFTGVSVIGTLARSSDGAGGLGLSVQNGGALVADRLVAEDNLQAGIQVRGAGSTALLSNTTITATAPSADGIGGHGLDVLDGGAADCNRCDVRDSTEIGVLADGPGTILTLESVTVINTMASEAAPVSRGVEVTGQAVMTMAEGEVTHTVGPAIHVSSGGQATVTGSNLHADSFAEVVLEDGLFSATDTLITDASGHPDIGGGVGFYGYGTSGARAADFHNVTVTGNKVAGLWFAGAGGYIVENSHLEGGPGVAGRKGVVVNGNAVFVSALRGPYDGRSGVQLTGNTLSNSYAGLLLDASSATVSGTTWADNTIDLYQQKCENVQPLVIDAKPPLSFICPKETLDVQRVAFTLTP